MKNTHSRVRNFCAGNVSFYHYTALLAAAVLWCSGTLQVMMAGPVTAAAADEKSAKAVTVHDMWSLPGIFGGGVKGTDLYTEGNVFLVLPVISTVGRDGLLSGDVLFIEPYSSWGEQGEVAVSLGLGWRHYITTQSVSAVTKHDGHQASFFEEGIYFGANVFVDMLDTQFDNQFWQLGVGAEVGTRYLEIRGNYYLPLSDKQLALEQRTKYSYQTTSSSTSQQASYGAPYATGNTLAQDVQYSTLTTTSTSTTTIEQLFRLYEEGMEGWDVQASVLVPGLDRYMDVFFIGGYYSFDNQPFGPQTGGSGNVEGWKAGVEVRPVPAVVLNATWYEDERFVGSDWLYGVRLEIPFEMGDLGDGKGFWGRVGAAFTPRRRHLAERLVEPVRRQNSAIKVGNDSEEKTEVNTSVKRVTKVVSQSPQQLVLADDVIFVNNGPATPTGIEAGTPTGTGTADQPVDTLQTGANLAVANSVATSRIWNVYTQGGIDYSGVTVPGGGGVRFIGSHMAIPGGSSSYISGHIPTVQGPLGIQAPNGGTYFGVFGYIFNGGNILADNYDQVEIVGNTLNTPIGTGITVSGSTVISQVLVQDNVVNNAGLDGIRLEVVQSAAMQALVDSNVIVNAGSNGIGLHSNWDSELAAVVNANYISGASNMGLVANSQNYSPGTGITLEMTGNAILDSGYHGVDLSTSSVELTATLTGNLIQGSYYYGAYLHGNGGTLDVTFTGNSFVDHSNGYQVFLETQYMNIDATFEGNYFNNGSIWAVRDYDWASLDMTFQGNHFLDSSLAAISASNLIVTGNLFESTTSGYGGVAAINYLDSTVLVQGNYFTDNSQLQLTANYGTMDATVTGNSFVDAAQGVVLDTYGSSMVTADISGNFMSGTSTGVSILAYASDPLSSVIVTVTDNVIQNTTSHGISAQSGGDGYVSATISGNHVSDAGGDAVNIVAGAGPSDFMVSGNVIFGSNIAVASPVYSLPATSTITVQDNYISEGSIVGNGLATFLITGNTIVDSPGDAISFMHDAGATLTISNNYIGNAGGAGIYVFKTMGTDPVLLSITGNGIVGTAGHGISVHSETDGSVEATIANNVIQDAGGTGILLNSTNDLGGITATVSGNHIEAAAVDGIRVEALNYATVNATIDSNGILDAGVNGITLLSRDAANLTATVSNNYISNAGNTGLQARVENIAPGTGMTLDITGNVILDSGNHGVDLYSSGEVLTATLTGNFIRGNFYYGTFLHGANGGTVHATFTGNNYVDHTNGYHVYADADGAVIDATFVGNTFSNGEVWLSRADDLGTLDLTFRRNHFLNSYLTAWSPTNLTAEGNLFETTVSNGYSGLTVFNNLSSSTSLVKDNYFTGYGWLYIAADNGVMDITVTGNSFVDTGREGVYIELGSADLQANISGNFMTGTLTGVDILGANFDPQAHATVTVADNVIQNTISHGIVFRPIADGTLDLNITGNHISGTGGHAMNLDTSSSNGVNNVLVSGNGVFGRDIVMSNNPYAWIQSNFTLQNNYLSEASIVGVNMHNVLVTGNVIEGSWEHALNFTYEGGIGAPATATITGNTITRPSQHGIYVHTEMDGSVDLTITDNLIQETGRNGIHLNATGMSSITGDIARNQIRAWGGDGIAVEAYDDAAVDVVIDGNVITESGWNGISLITESAANLTATVSNNHISYTNEMGVLVQSGNAVAGTGITVDITGNLIENTSRNAVNIVSQPGEVNATVTANVIIGAYYGAYLFSSGGPINATLTGNSFDGTGSGHHVRMESDDGTLNATLVQNNFLYGGISAERYNDSGTLNLTVQENYFDNGGIEARNVNSLTVVGNVMENSWVWPGGVNVSTTMDSTIVVQGNYLMQSGPINISAHDFGSVTATITGNSIGYAPSESIALQTNGNAHITADISGNAVSYSGGSGVSFVANDEAGITVNNFNGNAITDTVAGDHVRIEQGALATVQVTGDADNIASPSPNPNGSGQTLNFHGTTPTVNFLLNGVNITMPVDVP
jgi:hypothetical protein